MGNRDWRWTTPWRQATEHYCPACVAAGKFAAAYRRMEESCRAAMAVDAGKAVPRAR